VNPAGAEVAEADQGLGSVEPVAAVADQPDLGVESFEPGIAQPEPNRGQDPCSYLRIVRASLTKGLSRERDAQGLGLPRARPDPRRPTRGRTRALSAGFVRSTRRIVARGGRGWPAVGSGPEEQRFAPRVQEEEPPAR
jgi:hypothetical protein